MAFASGRRAVGVARALGFAAVLALTASSVAFDASAQPSFTSGDWGTADGGAVAVHANGSFDAAFTDSETQQAIFTTGKVIDRKPAGDKLELTLKPTTGKDTYIVVVSANGDAELYVVTDGARHKAAVLTK